MDSLAESRRLTNTRFARRNRLTTKGGLPRLFFNSPVGRKATLDLFLEPMARFLVGEFYDKPCPPPGDLGEIVGRLDSHELALSILVPLLDEIARGWKRCDDPSAEM